MKLHFYDEPLDALSGASVFLAGPTARGVSRTPWRETAVRLFEQHRFSGTLVLPEFREPTADSATRVFGAGLSPVPHLSVTSFNILTWETRGLERASVVLVWMPFVVGARGDPTSLPGFTTRAEVSRELERAPQRLVLGMPKNAVAQGFIRFHAARAKINVSTTLEQTVAAALALLSPG